MPSKFIGRRVRPEFTPKTGNYNPTLGQIARGATPSYATSSSACVGTFDNVSLTFTLSAVNGIATLTATASLPNVTRLAVSVYDVCNAHITSGAYTAPGSTIVSHISFQVTAVNQNIPATNILAGGQTYNALGLTGTMAVYTTKSVSGTIVVPASVVFLGNVLNQ